MKKLEKLSKYQLLNPSKIWGGANGTCYTYSENKNMSDAGFCDIVFKDDSVSINVSINESVE
jgi:hypothetical protein